MFYNQVVIEEKRFPGHGLTTAVKPTADFSFLKTGKVKFIFHTFGLLLLNLVLISSAFGATQTWSGASNTNWNVVTNWVSGSVPNIDDDILIPGGLVNYPVISGTITVRTISINNTGSGAMLTVESGGILTLSGAGSDYTLVSSGGTLIQNGGSITALSKKPTIAGTFTQTGGSFFLDQDLTLTGTFNQTGGLLHMAKDGSSDPNKKLLIVGGTLTINSTLKAKLITIDVSGTFNMVNGTAALVGITSLGTIDIQGGIITSSDDIETSGTITQSGGTLWMAATTSINPTDNFIMLAGTVTQTGGVIYTKDYKSTGGTFTQPNSNALLKLFHDWKPGTTHVFNSTAGTVQFSGPAGGSDFRSTNNQFYNIIVDADPKFGSQGNSIIKISNNFTNNVAAGLSVSTSTNFQFNGTNAQTISSNAGTNETFGSLEITNSSALVSLASNVNMIGTLTVRAGRTLNLSTYNLGPNAAPINVLLECGAITGSSVIGTGTLTLGAAVTVNKVATGTNSASLSSRVALSKNCVFTVANDGTTATDLVISGIISGAFGITKTGLGTMQLSGANTHTGVTTINTGILSVASIGNGGVASNLGAASNSESNLVLGGGTLQYTGLTASTDRNFILTGGTTSKIEVTANTLTISGKSKNTNGALTKTGAGTLLLAGANLHTGLTRVNEGTLKYGINNALSDGNVTVAGGTFDIETYTDAVEVVTLISGTIAGTTGVLTGTSYIVYKGSVSAILAGADVTLTKLTSGTVTLSALNTYSGKTTISSGILSVNTILNVSGGASALGSPTTTANGTINIAATGTLKYTGTGHSSNRVINLTASGGAVNASGSGILTLTGGATGNTFGLVLTGTGTGNFTGIIATATGSLTKKGSGNWIISGVNSYTGATAIEEGVLVLGASGVINNASPLYLVGGTFRTGVSAGYNETVGLLNASACSIITLGTGNHSLNFAASSTVSWTTNYDALITITGWVGAYNGTSGTQGKIFVGSSAAGLTSQQLKHIRFDSGSGFYKATILSTGEVVPTSDAFVIPSAPSNLVYQTPNQYIRGIAITPLVPSASGFIELFTVNPDLPEGLSMNPYSGIITGTPAEPSPATNYIITASNAAGSTQFSVSIEVLAIITNTGSGYWSSTVPDAPWPNGDVPTIFYDVFIKAGTTVTVDIPDAECKNLTLGTGDGIATLDFLTFDNPFLTVAAAVVVGGSSNDNRLGKIIFRNGATLSASVVNLGGNAATPAAGNIDMSAGGKLMTGQLIVNTVTGNTWLPGTGTVVMTATNTLPSTIFTSFNNLQIDAGTTTTGVAITAISGALTVKAGATFSLNHAVAAPTSLILECGALIGSRINGSATLTLGGNVNVINMATGTDGAVISAPLALGTANRTFTVEDDGTPALDLTVSGMVSGAFGAVKAGPGTMVFSGSNTYTGLTTISTGILKIGNSNALGTVAAGTTITSGAVLDLNGINYTTAEALTINGTGLNSEGALINSSATGATFSGLITLGSASSIIANSGNILISNTGTITGDALGLTLGGSGNGSISSIIGTKSGSLTKENEGVWTLSGNNTYTGSTIINAGTLKLGASERINNSSAVTVYGTFDLAGFNETLGSLEGDGGITSSASGIVILTVGSLNTDTEFSGSIEDGSATSVSLTKTGTKILTLSGSNSYSGSTLISSGTLKIGISDGSIPDNSAVTVNSILDLAGYSETIGSLAGTGTVTSSISGLVVLRAGEDNTNTTFSGIIQNGSGIVGLTKSGTGTLTLTGNNTYTGSTTLTSGTLTLGAANRIANGSAIIFNGGVLRTGSTIGYSETVGTLNLADNSSIALGTGSHDLIFSASNAVSWSAGKILTITGWAGSYNGTSGTAGRIFVGASATGLTASQLDQILFYNGTSYFPAAILATGEIVPAYNRIYTGTISGSPFCTGTIISVPYTSLGSFQTGNIFTAQLSNASGSFTAPVNIGTLSATTSGTISATIPLSASAGTAYRIRVISSNPVITGTDNGTNLTINLSVAVSVAITASANPSCSGVDVTFTATPTNGGTTPAYQWKVNGVNAGTNSATFVYKPANNDVVTCVLTSSVTSCTSNNPATSNTLIMTVNSCINKWKGTVSTNWNTPGNWTQNYVPAADADIIFDDAPVNHCLLDQNRSVTHITNTQASYRMVCNGYKLTIKGNLLFTNGAQIDASAVSSTLEFAGTSSQSIPNASLFNNEVYNLTLNNSNNAILNGTVSLMNTLTVTSGRLDAATNSPTVIYSGTSAQSISGSQYLNDAVYNLTSNNTAGVSLDTDLTINNNLNINAGKLFMIAAGKNLTVSGSITNSAGAAGFVLKSDATGTASLIHNTNNVPATVKRYISGAAEAWHFLSPPVSDQAIGGSWTPSGTYGNGTGYDLYAWNEPDHCWIFKLNTTTTTNWNTVHPSANFVSGRGYLYSVQEVNPIKEFAGNLNNGSVTYPLTFSSPDASLKGFNLLGNPYPSSVDWCAASGWDRSNLEPSAGGYDMWIWNPAAGNYGVCNSVTGIGTNSISRYIAPMQGYFVKAASSGNISLNNASRVHNGAGNWFKNESPGSGIVRIMVQAESDGSSDEAYMQFGYAENNPGAPKLFSIMPAAPSVYFNSGDGNYSVQYLTDTLANRIVPVSFKPGTDGTYRITCSFNNNEFGTLMLEDRLMQTSHDMKAGSTYSFTASATDDVNRFRLRLATDDNLSAKPLPARIYTDGVQLHVDLTLVSDETVAEVYDALGRLLLRKTLTSYLQHTLSLNSPPQVLIVRLLNRNGSITSKVFFNNSNY